MKENNFESLSNIIQRVLPELKSKAGTLHSHTLLEEWGELLGEPFSDYTKPLRFKNGILTVQVNSTAIMQELKNYEKRRLIETLQTKWPEVKDIKFKAY